MNDPRFWPFIAVIAVSVFVAAWTRYSFRAAASVATDDNATRAVRLMISLLVWPVSIIAAGWVDHVLWNMLAEQYGLPTLDLFSAIILGALVNSLFWTTGGIRRVWVDNLDP